jgi:hypothetical protein
VKYNTSVSYQIFGLFGVQHGVVTTVGSNHNAWSFIVRLFMRLFFFFF